MPDQPNPFVNPNQRGVELPAGCKDLQDVLEKAGLSGAFRKRVCGTVNDVRDYVLRLYETEGAERGLIILCPPKGAFLVLAASKGTMRLVLNLRVGDGYARRVVEELFGEEVIKESEAGTEAVCAPLSDL